MFHKITIFHITDNRVPEFMKMSQQNNKSQRLFSMFFYSGESLAPPRIVDLKFLFSNLDIWRLQNTGGNLRSSENSDKSQRAGALDATKLFFDEKLSL